jgi:F420-0:gamma-glutamyl ligase-like protein
MAVLTFGKYNGVQIENVPGDYLEWLISTRKKDIQTYQDELDRRAAVELSSLSMVERIIQSGFRALAKTMHPDVGGSTEQFKELQGSYEQLKGILSEVKRS